MDLSRMYRIAETGDVNDPTPVDNIMRMAEERQRQQQARPQSAWGRFKNFAGSNAGRTLWGGLGAGLGVALTGGNLQDALGYGVIGAGNTVGVLNQNKRYANQLKLKQQERADALAKEQRDRDFRTDMFNRQIEAQKEAANAAFERTLQQLAINNQYANERADRAREWAVEDRDVGQDFTREGWANAARQNELGRNFQADQARRNREFQASQAEAGRNFATDQALKNRNWALEDDARNNERYWERTQDSRDYAVRQLQDQRDYDAALLSSQRAYDEGLYDRRKEDERRYAADTLEDARAYEAGLRAEERAYQQEDEQRQFQNDLVLLRAKQLIQNAGYQPGDIVNGYVMTGNKKYDDAYLAQAGKNAAEQQKVAATAEKNYQTAVYNLDNLKNLVTDNPNLVGPYAPISAAVSRYTRGKLGMDTDNLRKRGQIVRNLGNIRNDLIAQAKANGQSGINTAREIEMATAGLNENSSAEEILGALEYMEKAAQEIRDSATVGTVAASTGFVKVQAPNGQIYNVPKNEVNDAINNGGKVV